MGFVWLGARLWDALEGRVPVIGVAKSRYQGTPVETELLRGASRRPLFITALGMPLDEAKMLINRINGKHRIPTLLKRVDQLCRSRLSQFTAESADLEGTLLSIFSIAENSEINKYKSYAHPSSNLTSQYIICAR